jgi:hypothetical protein
MQGEIPWCMIFADDIVWVVENLEVNNRLDELALERKGLRINKNKIEYVEYDFGGRYQEVEGTKKPTTISDYVIGEVENFKYLLFISLNKIWKL